MPVLHLVGGRCGQGFPKLCHKYNARRAMPFLPELASRVMRAGRTLLYIVINARFVRIGCRGYLVTVTGELASPDPHRLLRKRNGPKKIARRTNRQIVGMPSGRGGLNQPMCSS